ncbi:MAG: helix-turn-helix domain-containing protein, partial [Deltaproteobacteria bacterium]|nr:helix-turn-helix domain-containing protein [Deltaproteobacteria bacterium]
MTNADWVTTVRAWRERAGLSQRALAERIGATRQAIIAIEAGHRVPSTRLALQLARALGCTVDDLFTLPAPSSIHARLAPSPQQVGHRVALGRVGERWVAHRLPDDSPLAADGLLRGSVGRGGYEVEPLADRSSLESHVLVAGCAPLLGPLVARIGQRFADARGTWLPANSRRALDMLEAGLVHVAGLHLFDAPSGRHNLPIITARFGRQRMRVVALTRWRQGLVLAPGNPLSIRGPQCLQRPEVRFARREPGSGA